MTKILATEFSLEAILCTHFFLNRFITTFDTIIKTLQPLIHNSWFYPKIIGQFLAYGGDNKLLLLIIAQSFLET
jgi:hypothetical protein